MISSNQSIAKMFGKAIFFGSIQFAIGSVEMSSKFSVINFSKDQETLDNAAKALKGYMYISALWTLGTILVMYGSYGVPGAIIGLIANVGIILWIYMSYIHAFKRAAEKNNLREPCVFC